MCHQNNQTFITLNSKHKDLSFKFSQKIRQNYVAENLHTFGINAAEIWKLIFWMSRHRFDKYSFIRSSTQDLTNIFWVMQLRFDIWQIFLLVRSRSWKSTTTRLQRASERRGQAKVLKSKFDPNEFVCSQILNVQCRLNFNKKLKWKEAGRQELVWATKSKIL